MRESVILIVTARLYTEMFEERSPRIYWDSIKERTIKDQLPEKFELGAKYDLLTDECLLMDRLPAEGGYIRLASSHYLDEGTGDQEHICPAQSDPAYLVDQQSGGCARIRPRAGILWSAASISPSLEGWNGIVCCKDLRLGSTPGSKDKHTISAEI